MMKPDATQPGVTQPSAVTEPVQLLERYRAAVYARDVDALVALYAEDVRVFDMWNSWEYAGAAAWRAVVAGWFGSLGSDRVAVEFDEVQSQVLGDLAVVHAFVTYRGLSAQGAQLRSMHNRLTLVCRRTDVHGGSWQIVHEHSSSPADLETGRVVLGR